MGDINIVTQPTTDVPASVQASPAQPSPAQASAVQVTPPSTVDGNQAGTEISGTLYQMWNEQKAMIADMSKQIEMLKEQNAKLAMNATSETSNMSMEESMADFFGYNE